MGQAAKTGEAKGRQAMVSVTLNRGPHDGAPAHADNACSQFVILIPTSGRKALYRWSCCGLRLEFAGYSTEPATHILHGDTLAPIRGKVS
jgi:hypothetical protein